LESEHLKLRDFTINIPKYRNVRPSRVEILTQLIAQRGPIRIQQDLLELIAMSKKFNSISHLLNKCSKSVTVVYLVGILALYRFCRLKTIKN